MQEVDGDVSVVGNILAQVNMLLVRNVHFRVESIHTEVLAAGGAVEDLAIVRAQLALTCFQGLVHRVEVAFETNFVD